MPDPSRVVRHLLRRLLPGIDGWAVDAGTFRRLSRFHAATGVDVEAGRFFVTNAPLEQTRERIERGVAKHLDALHAFSTSALGAPFAVVLYPRAYQYSRREVPDNWERDEYTVLGPWVREPFRYFEERRGTLPYPVLNLLPAFQRTREFPLFQRGDPHWNPRGAAFVARVVASELVARELVPCRQGSDGRARQDLRVPSLR